MVAHYTAAKRKRTYDYYSAGGKAGKRPDRACIVYSNRIREAYGDVPIILGGLEASLRRFAHYDYWDNKVRRSILVDSRADILTYGMGEKILARIAELLDRGIPVKKIRDVRGTVYLCAEGDKVNYPIAATFDYNELKTDKKKYAEAFGVQYKNQDAITGRAIIEHYDGKILVQNPPMPPLERDELDRVYALPYARTWHPIYAKDGGVPGIEEVQFSITHNRGCFGACNFCALALHQGRYISARSHESVLREAKLIAADPDFKGYIHDVGGPTANFDHPACAKQKTAGACAHRQCLFPTPCPNLNADESNYLALLRKMREIPGVKKVFVRSGIRFDYMLHDKHGDFFAELVKHHVSGQLKVAPEHISPQVLKYMGKPHADVYDRFCRKYFELSEKCGKEQYLVPYLMSSHPGSGLREAIDLALYLKEHKLSPEQVQDFYPTPGTLSTAMYHTGIDPRTMEPVYVAKDPEEKAMQRALLQFGNPKNRALVLKALRQAGREDLIGMGKRYLVADFRPAPKKEEGKLAAGKGAAQRGGRQTQRTEKSGKGAKSAGKAPAKAAKPAAKSGGKGAKAPAKPAKRGKK
jgi:uncharacterized radical SAM protein YgiQ